MNINNKRFLKHAIAALLMIVGLMGATCAQQTNTNNLPFCPKLDYSKNGDIGLGGRTEKWHECWGRYVVEIHPGYKGDIIEGEWRNGLLNGRGTYYYQAGNQFKGDKYIGEFKDGNASGRGVYTHFNGNKYVGEFKMWKRSGLGTYYFLAENKNKGDKYIGEFREDKFNGQGVYVFREGLKQEGIFENDKLIRETRVSLAYIQEVLSNPDRYLGIEEAGLKTNLPPCIGTDESKWNRCFGTQQNANHLYKGEFNAGRRSGYGEMTVLHKDYYGDKYIGEWKNDTYEGRGTYWHASGEKYTGDYKRGIREGWGVTNFTNGNKYIGEFKEGKRHGQGIFTFATGGKQEGFWEGDKFMREARINLPSQMMQAAATDIANPEAWRQARTLPENRVSPSADNNSVHEQPRNTQRINLQVFNTQPNAEGDFVITVQTNADTSSLKINGEEVGGRADGNYTIKRVARAGQVTQFTIAAKDIYGNTDSKTISVTRRVVESNQVKYAELNPALIKAQPGRDAVAIIIGIAEYKNLPKADFANEDARMFYDYAIRGLGVKAENIKLLVDGDAGQAEIYKAFKTWLPSRVKSTTDVYVYYSGHGFPASDAQGLYLLPQLADRDLIEETAISQNKINAAIQAAKPKSVTIFLDSCYSGMARTGETLIASARPIVMKANTQIFPSEFTVITASQSDQISSSSLDLKHGIFSYYLMRGMEGEADANKDGKITTGEMHTYLSEHVARQASLSNRVQQPQLSGDVNKVLVGR